jgi:hydroxypyruvate isomerase
MVDDMPAPLHCSLNVSFFAPGRPLDDALDAAVQHGFHTIELLDPWAIELDRLEAALTARALQVDLINLPMGDFDGGERGYAGDPTRAGRFRADVEAAVPVIERLRPAKLNALTGVRIPGESADAQHRCLVEQLDWVVERLDGLECQLLIELLNPIDTPGYLLTTVDAVQKVLADLDGGVAFQLDVFHLARAGIDVPEAVAALALRTGHVQVADAPGRHEPGTGQIDFETVFSAIRASGYTGLIGCEYSPSSSEADPFAWMDHVDAIRA